MSTPSLNAFHCPLDPTLQWILKSNYVNVNSYTTKDISKILRPCSSNMVN